MDQPDRHLRKASPRCSVVWFRSDLRLEDNPALHAAAAAGGAVLPVFIWAPEEEGDWPPGAASKWWLHHSLQLFETALRRAGAPLVIRRGPTVRALLQLCRETGATEVCYNRRYEPAARVRDAAVERELATSGIAVRTFNSALLHEPWEIRTKAGGPFQVFTPFWRTCLNAAEPAHPLAAPERLSPPGRAPGALPLEGLRLLPQPDWAGGLRAQWTPGEDGARALLQRFLQDASVNYDEDRNRPDREGTSRLSPHLHFGEIGPRQLWHAYKRRFQEASWRQSQFLAEIGWREFAYHLLHHFPETIRQPLRPEFKAFPWRTDPELLEGWKRGLTGCPIVDAGMRQLWTTGWMHNRVRMIVASFLVKNLMIPWQEGAAWFWDTLVDADLANNTLGWQWTAGCGADAAPFFRIFNPVLQGEKFDPEGAYVRRWVPELAGLSNRFIHKPHLAPAGHRSGTTYPEPVVSLVASRERALQAYDRMRRVR